MPKKPPITATPKKPSVAEDMIKDNNRKKRQNNKLNKYIVTMTFPKEMEDTLKTEAEIRGMTVVGFLKYCLAKEIKADK